MSIHQLRVSQPNVRRSTSTTIRRDPAVVVSGADGDVGNPVGHGCLGLDDAALAYGSLAAIVSTGPTTEWRADLDQSWLTTGRRDLRVPRSATAPTHTYALVREHQKVLREEACATAVHDDRERMATDLYDAVIHRLFAAGLQLQSTCQLVDAPAQSRLEATIDLLDTTITELRKAIFSLR